MADKNEYVKLWASYESYFEAFSDVEVGRLVRAMIQYRVSREEPKFNGNERFIWPAIRRDIDESIKAQEASAEANRENGKKGGRPAKANKPTGFSENPKNPAGFSESEKSHGQGQGKGQGHGQGQGDGVSARAREDVAAVMTAYTNRIEPFPSRSCCDELIAYVDDMGQDCCLRAIQIAEDNNARRWSYIRSILRDKHAQGVRNLEQWDALEAKRQEAAAAMKTRKNAAAAAEQQPNQWAKDAVARMMQGGDADG